MRHSLFKPFSFFFQIVILVLHVDDYHYLKFYYFFSLFLYLFFDFLFQYLVNLTYRFIDPLTKRNIFIFIFITFIYLISICRGFTSVLM
ncbi:hypothetical protein C1646_695770 [Rhizophagus diaphanus]|nr:hypothetical protein C1646_695770 [Rhizophagus diaphanus] [Rhizophagus sp. MUCL 43196]